MKVHVFGQSFRVCKVKNLAREQGIVGFCDREEAVIGLDAELVGDEYWKAFLHEVLHAVVGRASLIQAIPKELEEVLVDQFATTIVENFHLRKK